MKNTLKLIFLSVLFLSHGNSNLFAQARVCEFSTAPMTINTPSCFNVTSVQWNSVNCEIWDLTEQEWTNEIFVTLEPQGAGTTGNNKNQVKVRFINSSAGQATVSKTSGGVGQCSEIVTNTFPIGPPPSLPSNTISLLGESTLMSCGTANYVSFTTLINGQFSVKDWQLSSGLNEVNSSNNSISVSSSTSGSSTQFITPIMEFKDHGNNTCGVYTAPSKSINVLPLTAPSISGP